MKLLSINVSLPKEVPHGRKTVSTGTFKEPVGGRIMLRTTNLDGDGQADLENHGGIDRAAYAYSIENYYHWQRELGRDEFTFGQFGENFTVEGMIEDDVHIGDVFRLGDALFEVSQPRPPCFKLGIKMAWPGSPSCFWRAVVSGSTCASWRKASSARETCSSVLRATPNGWRCGR